MLKFTGVEWAVDRFLAANLSVGARPHGETPERLLLIDKTADELQALFRSVKLFELFLLLLRHSAADAMAFALELANVNAGRRHLLTHRSVFPFRLGMRVNFRRW